MGSICASQKSLDYVEVYIRNPLFPNTFFSDAIFQTNKSKGTTKRKHQKISKEGHLVIVDISGFTKITENLSSVFGGAEIIQYHVNSYFSPIIDIIHRFGGCIEEFVGDALLCSFRDNSKTPLTNVICCCQSVLNHYQGVEGGKKGTKIIKYENMKFKLSLHFAIGVGTISRVILGGVNDKWKYLLLGEDEVFDQIERVMSKCTAGEIAVSREAIEGENIDLDMEKRVIDGGVIVTNVEVPKNEKSKNFIATKKGRMREFQNWKYFVDEFVISRIKNNTLDTLNIVKELSIVAVSLGVSLTNNDSEDESLAILNDGVRSIQKLVNLYEGHIINIFRDEKGVSVLLVFGFPNFHEDDSVRSLRFSLDLLNSLQYGKDEDVMKVRKIAVTRGVCYVGVIGNESRKDVNILSDFVNLCYRFADFKVPDDVEYDTMIVCDKTTVEMAGKHVKFESIGEFSFKGKKEKQRIFVPTEMKKRLITERLMFIDRKELSVLNDMTKSESTKLIFVQGDVGVGKSTLIKESLFQSKENINVVFQNFAGEVEKIVPFSIFKPLFEMIFKEFDIEQFKKSHSTLSAYLPLVNPYFGTKFDQEESSSIVTLFGGVKTRGRRVVEVLCNILTDWANSHSSSDVERSKVIMLENYQWFDNQSRSLISSMVANGKDFKSNLLIIISSRVPFDNPGKEVQTLEMKNLGPKSTDVFVTKFLSKFFEFKNIETEIKKYMYVQSNDNPFIIVELCEFLYQNSGIQVVNGTIQFENSYLVKTETDQSSDDSEIKELPTGFKYCITVKIDRLARSPQNLIKLLSVICVGDKIKVSEANHVHDVCFSGEAKFEDSLKALVFENLVEVSSSDEFLKFVHPAVRKVSENLVPRMTRSKYHRTAYEYLQVENMGNRELIVHHKYKAVLTNINQDASEVLETVQEMFKLGESFKESENYVAASQMYQNTMKILKGAKVSPKYLIEAIVKHSQTYRLVFGNGYNEDIEKNLEEARRIFRSEEDGIEGSLRFELLYALWHQKFFGSRRDDSNVFEEAKSLLDQSLAYSGPNFVVFQLFSYKAVILSLHDEGKFSRMNKYVDEAIKVYSTCSLDDLKAVRSAKFSDRFGGSDPMLQILLLSGRTEWLQGSFSKSKEHLSKANEMMKEVEDFRTKLMFSIIKIRAKAEKREIDEKEVTENLEKLQEFSSTSPFAKRFLREFVLEMKFYKYWKKLESAENDDVSKFVSKMEESINHIENIGRAVPGLLHTILFESYLSTGNTDFQERIQKQVKFSKDLSVRSVLYKQKAQLIQNDLEEIGGSDEINEAEKKQLSIENSFLQSINIAKVENAKIYQLRAMLLLTKYWIKTKKKRSVAIQGLTELIGSFTEEAKEVNEAKILLEELSNEKLDDSDVYLTYSKSISTGMPGKMTRNPLAMMMLKKVLSKVKDIEKSAKGDGEKMLHFDVNRGEETINTSDLLKEGPLVISFFRGAWCPFCTGEMKMLDDALARITGLGANVVAVGPDLKSREVFERLGVIIDIVIDVGNEISKKFGLCFVVGGMMKMMTKMNMAEKFEERNAVKENGEWTLPIPATYVVGQDGIIVKSLVKANFTERLEADEIVDALKSLFDSKVEKEKRSNMLMDEGAGFSVFE